MQDSTQLLQQYGDGDEGADGDDGGDDDDDPDEVQLDGGVDGDDCWKYALETNSYKDYYHISYSL